MQWCSRASAHHCRTRKEAHGSLQDGPSFRSNRNCGVLEGRMMRRAPCSLGMALVWIPATLVSGQADLGRSKGDPRCWTEPLWRRFREHCCQDESSWDRMRCGMPDFSYITFAKCCQGKGFYNSADNCLHSQSQHGEENFIIDTFQWQKKRDGVYVEMGAFDGITYSNTLRLHSCFGWRGPGCASKSV